MSDSKIVPAALAIEGLGGDARSAFEVAAGAGYRGIAFGTNHAELNPTALGESGRRHLRAILSTKRLGVESVRAAVPRGGLAEGATIDRTIERAREAIFLARELGVGTVSLHVGRLGDAAGVPEGTVVMALRELAQQADAAGLTLALGAEGTEALARVLKAVDFEGAKVNLDGSRVIGAGEDVLKMAELVGGQVGQWTAADAVRAGSALRSVALGEGQVPVRELAEMLEEFGFRGPVVVDVRELGEAGARRAAEVLARVLWT